VLKHAEAERERRRYLAKCRAPFESEPSLSKNSSFCPRKLSPRALAFLHARAVVCNAEHKQNDGDFIHLFPRDVMYLFVCKSLHQRSCADQNHNRGKSTKGMFV
jgi:hypothetical protein